VAMAAAAAVKVTALVALPFVVLAVAVAAPAPRRQHAAIAADRVDPRPLARAVALVGGPAAVVYLALAGSTGVGLHLASALRRTGDLVQWTSPPTAVGMSIGYLLRAFGLPGAFDPAVATARAGGLAALAGLVAALWWRAWRAPADRDRAAVLGAGLAFAGLALLGPVFYPWYALTPLALIAISTVDERVRAWWAAAAGVLGFLVLPNGVGLAPRTKLPGALVITAGLVAGSALAMRRRGGGPTTPTATASPGQVRSQTAGPRSGHAPGAAPGSPARGSGPPPDR
jgi:alpha-1,6-mannosyltransferase